VVTRLRCATPRCSEGDCPRVSQSYIHSVPQKFYESIQAGVPVLASDFAEMRRLVEAHQIGGCAPPLDAQAIADAVLELTSGAVSAEEWKRRCKRAADALTWEEEVRQLLDAVEHAIRRPRHSRQP